MKLSIDIETYSSIDLRRSGVYRYAESKDFEILLFAYSIDEGDVKVIDLASGEKIPKEIIDLILDETIEKWAFNANFERVCLSKYLGIKLKPGSWYCTMIWSLYLGLPISLAQVSEVLNIKKKKMIEGKTLIRYFSVPDKNGNKRNHKDYPYKWDTFKKYNKRDVEVEIAIQKKLSLFKVPQYEWDNYHLDQIINDRGVLIDESLVESAILISEKKREENINKAKEITGLENPNSITQLKEWLFENGIEVDSLNKKSVLDLIENTDGKVKEALILRLKLSKSSIKKYNSMKEVKCEDKRVRGLIQFYGASRTGRYSGRLIQVQNLKRNSLKDLDLARDLVVNREVETIDLLFDSTSNVLSQLIRTAFIPKDKFCVSDFSAIEARVLAWLSKERWRMKAFSQNKDIYCESASMMFNVPVEKHGVNSHLRRKGKIAELALGYQGSVGALKAMGASEMGLSDSEIEELVSSWRNSNQNIVNLWWEIDRIVKNVIKTRTKHRFNKLEFSYEKKMLFIKLPSGRRLAYVKPELGINKFGGESVIYFGVGSTRKWEKIESYGGKFVENIVQAIARDLLAEAMIRLENEGFDIVMHIHDEVVIESDEKDKIIEIMSVTPSWAKGLILDCDAYVCDYYRKD